MSSRLVEADGYSDSPYLQLVRQMKPEAGKHGVPDDVLDWFERHKPIVDLPWGNVYGCFKDVGISRNHSNINTVLSRSELFVRDRLYSLTTLNHAARAIGLGESLSVSFYAIASHFVSQIRSGDVQFVVTQRDENATMHNIIREFRRRNTVGADIEEINRVIKELPYLPNSFTKVFLHHTIKVPDSHLDWIEKNQDLVQCLPGVRGDYLDVDVKSRLGRLARFDVAHESFGAIHYSEYKLNSLKRLQNILNWGGIFMSNEDVFLSFGREKSFARTLLEGYKDYPEGRNQYSDDYHYYLV